MCLPLCIKNYEMRHKNIQFEYKLEPCRMNKVRTNGKKRVIRNRGKKMLLKKWYSQKIHGRISVVEHRKMVFLQQQKIYDENFAGTNDHANKVNSLAIIFLLLSVLLKG